MHQHAVGAIDLHAFAGDVAVRRDGDQATAQAGAVAERLIGSALRGGGLAGEQAALLGAARLFGGLGALTGRESDVAVGMDGQAHRVLRIDRRADAVQIVARLDPDAAARNASVQVLHVVGCDRDHRAACDRAAVDDVALTGLVLDDQRVGREQPAAIVT